MEDPKKSFFDEDPKEESTPASDAPDADTTEGEESEVRIPYSATNFPPPRNNGENLATISLILALASIFCCGIPASIAAIVTAILSRRALGRFTGSALAGLIIGIASVLLTVAMTVLLSVIMAIIEEIIAEAGGELLFLPLWR